MKNNNRNFNIKTNINYLYIVIIFIFIIVLFILYQIGIIKIKIDFFSNLLAGILTLLILLPLFDEINIFGVIKMKKDKHFNEKEGREIREQLANKAKAVPPKIKEKAKIETKDDPELNKLLYKFLTNNNQIQEDLNTISPATLKNINFDSKSILSQADYLQKDGAIDKELYLAIQYFCQKRNEIIHGSELSKKDLEEAVTISENILMLLWEIIEYNIDTYIEREAEDGIERAMAKEHINR